MFAVKLCKSTLFKSAILSLIIVATKGSIKYPYQYVPGENPTFWNYFDLINECGTHASNDIDNGVYNQYSIAKFPWMAKLVYVSPASTVKNIKLISTCGGVLITSKEVLTAGHCIKTGLMGVRLGDYHSSEERYCIGDICADPPQSILMKKSIKNARHNIAIIVLKEPTTFTNFVRPICLPWSNTDIVSTVGIAEVAGWGYRHAIQQKIRYESLHPHNMTIYAKDFCELSLNRTLTDQQFCAGNHFGPDLCRGVEGGPLMKHKTSYGLRQYYLVGVMVFGDNLCADNKPIGYINITTQFRWILNNLEPVAGQSRDLFERIEDP